MDEIECPECGSTCFTHPIKRTSQGQLTIDTEDKDYDDFDDDDESKCVLAEGNCVCAECDLVIEDGEMRDALIAMFRDHI